MNVFAAQIQASFTSIELDTVGTADVPLMRHPHHALQTLISRQTLQLSALLAYAPCTDQTCIHKQTYSNSLSGRADKCAAGAAVIARKGPLHWSVSRLANCHNS